MTDKIDAKNGGSGGGLSAADVALLLKDPSADNRASTAAKVARQLSAEALGAKELQLAQEILRVMARDAERRVREALALEAKSAKDLPRDVAKLLAQDEASVATPILEFSDVLTDQDLLEVIGAGDEIKQLSIAKRETVSEAVSTALIDKGSESVVAEVVGNTGAALSEAGLGKAIDRFGASERIQERIVQRETLPISISERLVSMVSEKLREHLVTHHVLPDDMATDLLLEARENATLGLVSNGAPPRSVEQLVKELHRNGRLTESIVLRAACLGDLAFVQAAMAELAAVPLINAQRLFDDRGSRGLKALFERTGMPPRALPVLRKAIDVMRETEYDGLDKDRERFSLKVLERLLTAFDTEYFGLSDDDIDYLMGKLTALTQSAGHGGDAARH